MYHQQGPSKTGQKWSQQAQQQQQIPPLMTQNPQQVYMPPSQHYQLMQAGGNLNPSLAQDQFVSDNNLQSSQLYQSQSQMQNQYPPLQNKSNPAIQGGGGGVVLYPAATQYVGGGGQPQIQPSSVMSSSSAQMQVPVSQYAHQQYQGGPSMYDMQNQNQQQFVMQQPIYHQHQQPPPQQNFVMAQLSNFLQHQQDPHQSQYMQPHPHSHYQNQNYDVHDLMPQQYMGYEQTLYQPQQMYEGQHQLQNGMPYAAQRANVVAQTQAISPKGKSVRGNKANKHKHSKSKSKSYSRHHKRSSNRKEGSSRRNHSRDRSSHHRASTNKDRGHRHGSRSRSRNRSHHKKSQNKNDKRKDKTHHESSKKEKRPQLDKPIVNDSIATQHQRHQHKGNWDCPSCKNLNFAFRVKCFRCDKLKPGAQKEQNWRCQQCQNINWERRTRCNRCGINKPDNAQIVNESADNVEVDMDNDVVAGGGVGGDITNISVPADGQFQNQSLPQSQTKTEEGQAAEQVDLVQAMDKKENENQLLIDQNFNLNGEGSCKIELKQEEVSRNDDEFIGFQKSECKKQEEEEPVNVDILQ